MSERDARAWAALKADPIRYQKYLDKKSRERKARPDYERKRKAQWRKKNAAVAQRIRRAGHAVEAALRSGAIIKGTRCADCCTGRRRLEAHHHKGYERRFWLEIVWLCPSCHRKADKQIKILED